MSIYDFSARLSTGEERHLADYRGKVLLVVNVASKCGFTPQYKGLQNLCEQFGPRGFEVLAFPCDQFGHQEPGSDAEISAFCERTYGVNLSSVRQDRGQRQQRPPALCLAQAAEGRALGRRHKVEFYEISG
jgi:glutathione peroxidase